MNNFSQSDTARHFENVLPYIDPDPYENYFLVLAALKHEESQGNISGAKDIARQWARQSSKFNEEEFNTKWASIRGENGGEPATGASITDLAKSYGWQPGSKWANDEVYTFGNAIDISKLADDDPKQAELPEPAGWSVADQADQIKKLLNIYEKDDYINLVFDAKQDPEDLKWKPNGMGMQRRIGSLVADIDAGVEKGKLFGEVYASSDYPDGYNPAAGVWFRINPLDGKGIGNANVTRYMYALVESDNLAPEMQLSLMKRLQLPMVLAINSGGKSVHAIVKVDAKDKREYDQKVKFLYQVCEHNGLSPDKNDKNPARLSRLPGVNRGDRKQCIVYSCDKDKVRSFEDWTVFVQMGVPKDIMDDWDTFDPEKEMAPEMISGILRQGHKMLIAGSSKAGKSFLLIQLAYAIATGTQWLGRQCMKGRVLYFNFEIDPPSFKNRVHKVVDKLGGKLEKGRFDIWNLRGIPVKLDELIDRVIAYARGKDYTAIILDPLYKLMLGGDENSAGDIGKVCVAFDRLASQLGASVIYCHHFSKGTSYQKAGQSIADRASGSGVFGRDPDAIMTLNELEHEPVGADDDRRGFKISSVLREFPQMEDFNCFFKYPVHIMDEAGELKDAKFSGDSRSQGGKAAAKTRKEQSVQLFLETVEALDAESVFCSLQGHGKVFLVSDIAKRMHRKGELIKTYVQEVPDQFEYFKVNNKGYVKRINPF